jgi:hypothetical protein
VWWCVYYVGKELIAEARNRRETRIWIECERLEGIRLEASIHQQRLAAIEATRLKGIRELHRIAAEAKGEIIEGKAVEVKHETR